MNYITKHNYSDEIQNFLHSKLSNDVKVTEKCINAVEVYYNINWKRHFRLIALIRKRTSHAVAIFKGKKLINESIRNLHLIDILPFNHDFILDTDETRSSNGDFHPAILYGVDYTLLDIDPLSCPIDSISGDPKNCNRKKIYLDFLKEDFATFSEHLINARNFIPTENIFSSFDWLKKLKDDADSVSDITDGSVNSDSDSGSRPLSDNSSPNNTSKHDSSLNHVVSSEILPVVSGLSNSLSSYKVSSSYGAVVAKNFTNNAAKKSMVELDRPSHRSLISKIPLEHCQSTPDLLNVPSNNIARCPSDINSSINDDRQFHYLENKLRQKENDYCNWKNHILFVGTWNVNGRLDDSLCLDDWLTPPKNVNYPNFYIIGLQEIDLSIGSVALNRGNTSNLEERWLKLIENSLPFRKKHYERLYRSRLAGILLTVYIEKSHTKLVPVTEVMSNKVATGMFNVMGNKGAVGIRFRALDSNLCFINCHLAAGESNRLRRDQDFREIEKNLMFCDQLGRTVQLYEHDLIFLMGDLNYRILNLDASVAKEMANNNMIEKLLGNDELLNYSKSVFKRFYEGSIKFIPTYKFDPYTDDYDTSEKNRVPSFCDRIMWVGDQCRLLKYSSHMSLKTSDHKPVSAFFNIGLKKIDPKKRLQVQEAIIRSMDLIYNLSLPQAKIDRQEINFDNVHFYEHMQASITMTNTGHNEFDFNFKEIPGCQRIPDWLTVQPAEGTVKPGDTCEMVFEIFINANNVSGLNTKAEVQCILVLMLQGGKDYFITVTADLVPTCFGLPLSLLVSLKDPIATFSRKELYDKCKPFTQRISGPSHGPNAFTTPKEMYVMVDYLLKHIDEEELFARPGSHSEIQSIREELDTNGSKANFSNVCVHSVSEALLMFLSSLYFPIIPTELLKECMGVHNNFIESVKVISKLPLDHQNMFHYLTSFLRKVLQNRSENGTDFGSLGILFVDLIFRPKSLESSEREICSNFIKQFLVNDPAKYFRQNSSMQ